MGSTSWSPQLLTIMSYHLGQRIHKDILFVFQSGAASVSHACDLVGGWAGWQFRARGWQSCKAWDERYTQAHEQRKSAVGNHHTFSLRL